VFGVEGAQLAAGLTLDGGRDRARHRHHRRACAGLPPHPDPVDASTCRKQPARRVLVANG
jgi:hypothetical protein